MDSRPRDGLNAKGFFATLACDTKYAMRSERLLIAALIAALFVQVVRIFYCVDVTDESYYFTNIIRMIQGDDLFINIWDGTQTSALPVLPFYWLFSLFFDFDGILLFGRFLSLSLRLVTVLVGYYALSFYFGKRITFCTLFVLVIYAPFSLYTLGYNNAGFLFCILGSFLWLAATVCPLGGKRRCVWLIFAGFAHACMVASYPTTLVIVPALVVAQFLVTRLVLGSGVRALKDLAWYGLGAFLVAGSLLIYVVFFSTVSGTLHVMGEFLSAPYSAGNDEFQRFSISVEDIAAMLGRVSVLAFLAMFALLSLAVLATRRRQGVHRWCCLGIAALYPLWICVIMYVLSPGDHGVLSSQDAVFLAVIPLPCLLLCLMGKKTARLAGVGFLVLGAPSLCLTIMVSLSSGGAFKQGKYALVGLLIFTLLVYWMVLSAVRKEISVSAPSGHCLRVFTKTAGFFVCFAIIFIMLAAQFLIPYRDTMTFPAGTRVQSGPAAGLLTSADRASMLDQMQTDMDSVRVDGGTLLVVECYPYAYGLAPSMRPAAPSTWLVSSRLGMGTSNYYWTNLFDYYAEFETSPDVIFLDNNNRLPGFMANPKASPEGDFDMSYAVHRFILEEYRCEVYRDTYSLWVRN